MTLPHRHQKAQRPGPSPLRTVISIHDQQPETKDESSSKAGKWPASLADTIRVKDPQTVQRPHRPTEKESSSAFPKANMPTASAVTFVSGAYDSGVLSRRSRTATSRLQTNPTERIETNKRSASAAAEPPPARPALKLIRKNHSRADRSAGIGKRRVRKKGTRELPMRRCKERPSSSARRGLQ